MITQRSNTASLVGGMLLIGFGSLALFGQLFRDYHLWSYLWPLAVLGGGLLFFAGMFAGGKSMAGMAIPGAILTVSGLMSLAQNLGGFWASGSYSWTITLASVGLGIFIMGHYQSDEKRRQTGLKVMQVAAVLFVVFGALSQLAFARAGYTFPLLLILLGVALLLSRSGLIGKRQSAPESDHEISA